MTINLLQFKNLEISKQLEIEKKLLHTSDENWCIINEGFLPTIVLGVSSKKDTHINDECPLPIIRRFSGGGVVVVDKNTIFASFIFSKKFLNFNYPEEIFKWMEDFYKKSLKIMNFKFLENDFIIDNKKCIGNALYIKKNRWLHHSSLLWDFDEKNMKFLKYPNKTPPYRNKRDHQNFLCTLNKYFPSKKDLKQSIISELEKRFKIKKPRF